MIDLQDGFLIHRKDQKAGRDAAYAILMTMAMTGLTWIMATAFTDDPVLPLMIPAAMAGAWLPLVRPGKLRKAVYLLPAAAALLAVTVGRKILNGGFLQMINHCIRSYNYINGTDVYYYTVPGAGSGRIAQGLAAALILLIAGFLFDYLLSSDHVGLFALVNILAVLPVFILQSAASYMACCFTAMAIPAAVMRAGAGRQAGRRFAVFLAILMAVGTTASLAYMKWGSYEESAAASGIRESVVGRLDAWRYGEEDSYTGSLDRAASYKPGEDVRLKVTASEPGTYYLKGFVGGVYANGEWSEIEPSSYNRYHEGLFDWLAAQGFLPLAQNSDYMRLLAEESGGAGDSERTISVVNENANRKFCYIPYGLTHETVEGLEGINHDMNLKGGDEEGEYKADYYDMSTSLSMQNPAWMEGGSGRVADYREAQEEYRDFVYKYYLETDPEIEAFLNGRMPGAGEDNHVKLTIEIRNWLADEKTADAGAADFGGKMDRDYLYYFMGRDRRGNSSFYASAAVMMYRHCGIPARYAEGYIATVKDAGRASDVTGIDIHAWPEIYRDGIGWVPVEVTPGYYDDLSMIQQEGNKRQDPLPPQEEPEEPEPLPQSDDTGTLFSTVSLIKMIALLLAAIVAAVLIRRWIILFVRKRRLDGNDTAKAMATLTLFIRRLLDAGGLAEDDIPEEETGLLMRYRFRDGEIEREDYERLREYACGLQKEVFSGLGWAGRLRMLFMIVLR